MANDQSENAKKWLQEKVFPLWLEKGIDPESGAFVENLTFDGEPMSSARRALVQARQIYSMVEAWRLELLPQSQVENIVEKAVGNLVHFYGQPSGAYIHSINSAGQPVNKDLDLYTQAFVLFGLGQAFDLLRKPELKQEAIRVLHYLNRERRLDAGGYTEIKDGQTLYQSNPHMHLFESALLWAKIDNDHEWVKLCGELFELCKTKFIDAETGFLAEHFDSNWKPVRESGNGAFIFEPGHHFEWAWLFYQYKQISGHDTTVYSRKLFELAEKYGLSENKSLALDEILSNKTVKKSSSRFWPQCERIKAALVLGHREVADVGMKSLFENFLLEKGLWRDTLVAKGEFTNQPAKGSSLYHIINAISEYVQLR